MGPGIQERMAAVRAARTVYRGDSSGLGGAWGEFKTWLADRKLRQADWLWEVYLTDPSTSPDPATWTTELNQPLLDDAG
jgi:effector-binding domain-containing protein